MNTFIFTGNLTRDPSLTEGDKTYCKFCVAVNRKEEVDFFDCIAWGALAENVNKYCKKGDKVLVVGTLQIRKYETKSGEKRSAIEITAREVEFIGYKAREKEGSAIPQESYKPSHRGNLGIYDDDDNPF